MQAIELMQAAGFYPYGIVHVGANEGQERFFYHKAGPSIVIYIEPIDYVFNKLISNISSFPGHIAIQAVCSSRSNEIITFNVASNSGLSSSILPLGSHADFHPNIIYSDSKQMVTTTLDDLLDHLNLQIWPNLLIIDTQGADLMVLKGSRRSLATFDGVFVEVSNTPLYEGGCTHQEITDFLNNNGFKLDWTSLDANGHGDAFYSRISRNTALPILPSPHKNIALGKSCTQSSQSKLWQHNNINDSVNEQKNGGFSFHTEEEQNPWWQIDLGDLKYIYEIRVFNRLGVTQQRSKTLQILTSEDCTRWCLLHDHNGKVFGGIDGRPLVVKCEEKARYVRLKLNEFTYLHLDGIEIYGE